MFYRLVLALLMGALCVPASTASAEPVQPRLRLVPGDAFHYTLTLHIDASSLAEARTFDATLGVGLVVDEQLNDGSVRVRQTIDGVTSSEDDPEVVAELLGKQSTFIMHPDGSTSELVPNGEGGDPLSGALGGSSFGALSAFFPPGGLEVGQTYETEVPFGGLLPGMSSGGAVPVTTTLQRLVTVDGRPAARLMRTVYLPEFAIPFGPFGASGSASFSAGVEGTSLIDLEIGWPLSVDATIDYTINFATGEGDTSEIAVGMDYGLLLDDQALVN